MRSLEKLAEPEMLTTSKERWSNEVTTNPTPYNKTRYRHTDIKRTLLTETSCKCVYCESKIGHNTPGDVEHMKPTSVAEDLRFEWLNMTIACTECNSRKNDYFSEEKPFINPYVDNVEDRILHAGPYVWAKTGDDTAEITVRVLEFNNLDKRAQLFARKVAKIKEVQGLANRLHESKNVHLRAQLLHELSRFCDTDSEYSAMVKSLPQTRELLTS